MVHDPFARLDAAIATSARERDSKRKQSEVEREAMERQRDEAIAIWSKRNAELPAIVQVIDGKLKDNGFSGVVLGVYDRKHSDIGRAVIVFEHNPHNFSKIQFCVTRAGEFSCAIETLTVHRPSSKGPVAELTEDRFREVLGQAVSECLSGNPASTVASVGEAVQQKVADTANPLVT